MQLSLSKKQSTGVMGGGKLTLFAKVKPTAEEEAIIKKFKMNKEVIWQKSPSESFAPSFLGVKTMTVGSLVGGETYTCKDIGQMIEMEEFITRVAKNLKTYVDAAKDFGGDITIDL